MPPLSNLPVTLVTDHLLPILPVRDLLALGAINRDFANVCNAESLWKHKCEEDFGVSSSRISRKSGWKTIYKGLKKPKVFIWGDNRTGGMGSPRIINNEVSDLGVPYPVQLEFSKGPEIVELVASRWSFNALDSHGRIHVWGALGDEWATGDGFWEGNGFQEGNDFSNPRAESEAPLRLELPENIQTVKCGWQHSVVLDARGHIWTFGSWGNPFRLIAPELDCSTPDSTPVQVECDQVSGTALTASGDIYCWSLAECARQHRLEMNAADKDKRVLTTPENTIPCVLWDLHHSVRRVPALPNLPRLLTVDQEQEQEETRVVSIAVMYRYLIALTNKGHVLKFSQYEHSLEQANWEYLPKFSESAKIRAHPAFSAGERDALSPPREVRITRITARYDRFFAYTQEDNSIVLEGNSNTTAKHDPRIIPELQNKSIISISLGDNHNVALSASGKVYTWGKYINGNLGLGDPKELPVGSPGGYANQLYLDNTLMGRSRAVLDVQVPTEVRFGRDLEEEKEYFCLAVTAAGWHSGALVIDLDREEI